MRLYELAKLLKLPSKQLLSFYKSKGIRIKSNLSALKERNIRLAKKVFKQRFILPDAPELEAQRLAAEERARKAKKEKKTPPTTEKKEEKVAKKPLMKKRKEEKVKKKYPIRKRKKRGKIPVKIEELKKRLGDSSLKLKEPEPKEKPKPVKRKAAKPRRSRRPLFVAPKRQVFTRPTHIDLWLPVTVRDLSAKLGVKANELIRTMLKHDIVSTINNPLAEETILLLGLEHGTDITIKKPQKAEDYIRKELEQADRQEDMQPRPPIVTLLGHVDHGKTTLLDKIRQTNVQATEAGGITQHISAYKLPVAGEEVTFVDTPGHEAFTKMRARGANVTDIVVLVVAADDGVMPQTREAVSHARAAGVPIMVAINKIDKPNANPTRTKQQLVELDLSPEEWSGKTVAVEVSALTGSGIDELLEMLVLIAEMESLRANPNRPAIGYVLEAKLSEGTGAGATLVIKNGTLRRGDIVVAGTCYGKVQALYDTSGYPIDSAAPSTPVQVTGFSKVPEAGERVYVVPNIQKAKAITEERKEQFVSGSIPQRQHISLENLFASIEAGKTRDLRLIIKADVKGSVEVLKSTLQELSTDEVRVKLLHAVVGSINESDVLLADASDAIIIGFSVTASEAARSLAKEKNVDLEYYDVIYNLIKDIRAAMEGLLEPEQKEFILGEIEVKQIFKASRYGTIAGCMVTSGVAKRAAKVRVMRDEEVLFTGNIKSLRRFTDDVKEVKEGFECGLTVDNFDEIEVGDKLKIFEIRKVARTLK